MESDKSKILEQLKLILDSSTFVRSKINKRLLTFLVEESLKGSDLREVTIGSEIFGESYDPVKDDNKVRVYVYNLRKKLADYYSKNPNDGIIFTIEKGQYKVVFATKKDFINPPKKKIWLIPIVALVIAVFAILFLQNKQQPNPLWQDNLEAEFPTTVVIGDVYTILTKVFTGRVGVVRDFSINTDADYNRIMAEHPELAMMQKPGVNQYSTRFAPYCTKTLSCYFTEKKLDFNIKLLSDWDATNIHKENIVYFGQTKTMRGLKNVLEQSFPNYEFGVHTFTRTYPETNETLTFKDEITEDKITDYTIVSKTTTQAGNTMKFFLSDQDCGAIQAIEYFTNEDSVLAFYDRHNIEDQDFIALFKVVGWERKGYEMEFILLDVKE